MTSNELLQSRFPQLQTEENFSFARHTSIGCGGVAELAVSPTLEEIAPLLRFLQEQGIEYRFLGAGANVLPQEGTFRGVIVRFTRINALNADGKFLYAGAGVTGGRLCRYARARSLSGFEPFTGIPMTVGGGIVMNAGVSEGHFSDVVRAVLAIENGKLRIFSRADCKFAEKKSVFQDGIAVVGALLQGRRSFEEEVARRTCYFRAKRAHLPKGRSMGCTFVNPPGGSAGKLIEDCGLKWKRIGGARVSGEHANFIINDGGTSCDVAALIAFVKDEVWKKTGIMLLEEIRPIP